LSISEKISRLTLVQSDLPAAENHRPFELPGF